MLNIKSFTANTSPLFGDGTQLKFGILGGTFNPPHIGHLRLAEEVVCEQGLDHIVFMPSFIPPHKNEENVASARHRLTMTSLACADNPRFRVSDFEVTRQGPSFTVNTLSWFSEGQEQAPFFIMGADSLKEIATWRDYSRLFELSSFIVVSRPGTDFDSAWEAVPEEVRFTFDRSGKKLMRKDGKAIIQSDVRGLDVSSTTIRALIGKGESIRYLVTESVRLYIVENRLYGC